MACPSSGTARLTLTAPDRDTLQGNGPATHYVVGKLGILDGTYATLAGFVLDPPVPRVTIDISTADATDGLLLQVIMDAESDKALGFLAEPQG